MLTKPWSISTTVRNPRALAGILGVLAQMEGAEWDRPAQMEFQIRLIQARLYGARNNQFYAGLPPADIALLEGDEEISRADAGRIFGVKDYEDPSMRGAIRSSRCRNSASPTSRADSSPSPNPAARSSRRKRTTAKFSSAPCSNGKSRIRWTAPGFPPRCGYNIKPFVGALRLVNEVNRECEKSGLKQKGLSLDEFEIFALTLIDWRKIETTAREILHFRGRLAKIPRSEKGDFIGREARRLRPEFNMRHLRDYADNAVRYFRMTGYIRVRGADDHIDIDPLRRVEVDSLLARDSAEPDKFKHDREYAERMGSATVPGLPGERPAELLAAIGNLRDGISKAGGDSGKAPPPAASASRLKSFREKLREKHFAAVGRAEKKRLAEPDAIRACADELRKLTAGRKRAPNAAETLERLSKSGLDALNDAREIRANYPSGEDGVSHRPGPGGKAGH